MQKYIFYSLLGILTISGTVSAQELLPDEQGPTAPDSIATTTANDDFLLPAYTIPEQKETSVAPVPSEVDILNEIFGSSDFAQSPSPSPPKNTTYSSRTFQPHTARISDPSPTLIPLPKLAAFAGEDDIEPFQPAFKQKPYADQALASAKTPSEGVGKTRELRIRFYPGQSSFSSQALKWVKSFAVRVVNDPLLLVEIRVSAKNWPLQKKRLSILAQILKETGISAHQVRLYTADRDENSLLVRYARNSDYTQTTEKASNEKEKTIDW